MATDKEIRKAARAMENIADDLTFKYLKELAKAALEAVEKGKR